MAKNSGRNLSEQEKAKKKELHAIIMKCMCLDLLPPPKYKSLNKKDIFQVQPLYKIYANLSLFRSMPQPWQRKGEPLPYVALCSVTFSSSKTSFKVILYTPHALDTGLDPSFPFVS